MKRKNWLKAAEMTGYFVVFLMFTSLAVAGTVDNETCLGCHDEYDASLKGSAHQLTNTAKQEINCISCHAGGEEHADDPSIENISNPANLDGEAAFDGCTNCHMAHVEFDNFGYNAHQALNYNCNSCHTVHQNSRSLLIDNDAKFCTKCHAELSNKLSLVSSHPINEGAVTCLSCHGKSMQSDVNMIYDMNRVCQDCHQEQSGPFLYEHDASNGYMVDGGGCIECHDPHSSTNDRLLKQSGNNICNQCHVLPSHEIAHGGAFNNYSCVTCHSQTHGSFNSNLFLDPNLPAIIGTNYNCYQSGCHTLNSEE